MKKLLLVAILCLTPLFVSHAAFSLSVEDCVNWKTYNETPTTVNFEKLPIEVQQIIRKKEEVWNLDKQLEIRLMEIGGQETWKDRLIKLLDKCEKLSQEDVDNPLKPDGKILQEINIVIEKESNDIQKIEVRARMPFVHHGNILPGPKEGESGSNYLEQKFIPKFVNGSLIFLMSLSILMVIIGGLMFVFSSGDSDLTTRAKTTITWSIVGVVLTILSYAIVQFIIGIDFTL